MKKSLCNIPTFIQITISILIFITLYPLKIAVASQYVVIDSEVLNIRNKPSLDASKVIGTTQKGKKYALVSENTHVVIANPLGKVSYIGGTWYQIKLTDGSLGWVAGSLQFRNRDLSWYTRKSNSGSPSWKETKTFSHKIIIPNQTRTSKQGTHVSRPPQEKSYRESFSDDSGLISIGVLVIISIIIVALIKKAVKGFSNGYLGSGSMTPTQGVGVASDGKEDSLKLGYSRGSWSGRRTGFLGDKYTQHYAQSGSKAGYSENRSGILGDSYTQHYDRDSSKSGYSKNKASILGNSYTQHHDQSGSKIGRSEKRTSLLGDSYTQHYDNTGNKAGYSEKKTDIFGSEYWQHYNQDGSKKD